MNSGYLGASPLDVARGVLSHVEGRCRSFRSSPPASPFHHGLPVLLCHFMNCGRTCAARRTARRRGNTPLRAGERRPVQLRELAGWPRCAACSGSRSVFAPLARFAAAAHVRPPCADRSDKVVPGTEGRHFRALQPASAELPGNFPSFLGIESKASVEAARFPALSRGSLGSPSVHRKSSLRGQ